MSSFWDSWGNVTRLLESTTIALRREVFQWQGLELADVRSARLKVVNPPSKYEVALDQHLAAIQDLRPLYEMVLVYSYALAEGAALVSLSSDSRQTGGIEYWGGRILANSRQEWDKVKGGKAGAVEVAVARNCVAHGGVLVDAIAASRLAAAGSPLGEGHAFVLTYELLDEYRARLRSLLRLGAIR